MTDNGFDVQAFQVVEGLAVSYRFLAKECSAVKLTGYVELGAALSHAIGPTTMRQFGRVRFSGKRHPN